MSAPNDNAGDDIVALARQLFGEAAHAEALALVDQYGTEPHEREVNRVQRALFLN